LFYQAVYIGKTLAGAWPYGKP